MNDIGSETPNKPLGTGPKARICYICGRPYGTNSYEIHLKQCKDLWIAREAKKDPKERKKLPEDPFANSGGGGFSTPNKNNDHSASNSPNPQRQSNNANSSGNDGGGGGGGAMTLEEMNKIAGAAFNTEALDTCKWCNRTFLPEKLVIHNRSCTQDTPARSLAAGVRAGAAPVQVSADASPVKRPMSQAKFKRPPRESATNEGTDDGGSEAQYTPEHNKNVAKSSNNSNSNSNNSRGDSRNGNNSSSRNSSELNSADADGDGLNLRVSNGSLVGHLGGASGRELRKSGNSAQKNSNGTSHGSGSGIASPVPVTMPVDLSNQAEVFTFLNTRLASLETSADTILSEIADIKSFIGRFKVSYNDGSGSNSASES